MATSLSDRLLATFGDDLWIDRRLNLDPVIEFIRTSREDAEQADLTRFVEFLRQECSGDNYVHDRQWGELLNAMKISRKLNHRTVKFKDILKNRQIITSNAREIQQSNARVNLSLSIETLLTELDRSMQDSFRLELPGKDEPKADTFLIGNIRATRDRVNNNCLPIIRTLRVELDNELLSSSSVPVSSWTAECQSREKSIRTLTNFLDSLLSLEVNLQQLEPLIESSKQSADLRRDKLSNSIEDCKCKFWRLIEFHDQLVTSLRRVAERTARSTRQKPLRCPLMKLLDPKSDKLNDDSKLESELNTALRQSEECRLELDMIMQSLRLEFGRFYFVSDVELLSIVALDSRLVEDSDKSLDCRRLITKLFNNSISSFRTSNGQVTGVQSPHGEVISFSSEEFVPIKKRINVYSVEVVRILNEICRKLRRCLRRTLVGSLKSSQIVDWSLPAQLITLAESIRFCDRVERSFSEGRSLDALIETYESRFGEILNNLNDKRLEWLAKFKVSAVISMNVHFVSQLLRLRRENVKDANSLSWQKQMKFYLVDGEVEVHILDCKFTYKFDYLPLQLEPSDSPSANELPAFKRLISTDKTQQCMLVASQAICKFRLGANPFGPAGGGKTETIKALGQLLGQRVIVHNCDQTNDRQSLERLIWGLAHTGLWGCFDEFNRLDSSVLSSVSGVLELVQRGLRGGRSTLELASGQLMCLDPSSAFFITLNPGDKTRYRGRRRLPANLRSLFMPISMASVQIEAIVSESLLTSSVFRRPNDSSRAAECLDLAQAFDSWLRQMRQRLGNASYCEWDLRLVMAVMRRFRQCDRADRNGADLMVQSIECEIRSRLESCQWTIARGALSECFGSRARPDDWSADLRQSIGAKLPPTCDVGREQLLESAVQLSNQLDTRTGVLLLGPPKSAKSMSWKLLAAARGDTVRCIPLNPRFCSQSQLLGGVDRPTGRPIDGLLTAQIRKAQNMLHEGATQVWIVLDGPVDPDWIECLNSVLDDNQTLTLSTGERLDFCPRPDHAIKLIIEATDCKFASPATMSRLGLILFQPLQCEDRDDSGEEPEVVDTIVDLVDICRGNSSGIPIVLQASRPVRIDGDFISYNCSRHSRSGQLIELLQNSASCSFILINNIELIEPEDEWSNRTFIELLRFIMTYKGYYDNSQFRNVEAKFIIVVESFAGADRRILAMSRLMRLTDAEPVELRALPPDGLARILEAGRGPILTLTSPEFGMNRRENLRKLLDGHQVLEFRDSSLARISIDHLRKEINDKLGSSKQPTMFILSDTETRLLSLDLRRKLFHLLNFLAPLKEHVKFVYLCHEIQRDGDAFTFWSSLGPIYSVTEQNDVDSSDTLRNSIRGLGEDQADYLHEQLQTLVKNRPIKLTGCFVETLTNLSRRFDGTIQKQRQTLRSGLDSLADFERHIRTIKLKRLEEDVGLAKKKEEIEGLMKTIDAQLTECHRQQAGISLARAQQDSKIRAIQERSLLVESELASVRANVESSKLEIQQTLKPEALNEIRTLRSPPKAIKDILDALFVLLGHKDSSWSSIKAELTRNSLREAMTSYNFEKSLTPNLLSRVESKVRGESFKIEQAARASAAIVPILRWILAALDYGKVLTQLAPMTREMDNLNAEYTKLEAATKISELKQNEIKELIETNKTKLNRLEEDFLKAQVKSEKIKSHIEKAERSCHELDGQVTRWRKRLEEVDYIISSNQVPKLALLGSYLATLWSEDGNLADVTKQLELGPPTESLAKLMSLSGDGDTNEFDYSDGHADKILKLVSLKFCLDASNLIACIEIGSPKEILQDDLLRFLGFRNILCEEKDLFYLSIDDDWRRSFDLANRLDKTIILDMSMNRTDSSAYLDILNCIMAAKSSRRQRIILLCSRELIAIVGHLLREPIQMREGDESEKDIEATIMKELIHRVDRSTEESMVRLMEELRCKTRDVKTMEFKLLNSLTSISRGSFDGHDGASEDIVSLLIRLNEVSVSLTDAVEVSKSKLSEQRERVRKYVGFCREAAKFYANCLVPLRRMDRFYHLPIGRYVQKLHETNSAIDVTERITFEPIIEMVNHSLRPEARLWFDQHLNSQGTSPLSNAKVSLVPKSLGQVSLSLLKELETCDCSLKLMTVLHDATKPSPQLEIDELFNDLSSRGDFVYNKIYASSYSNAHLEATVTRILSAVKVRDQPTSQCLCLVNAHLYDHPARLLRLIRDNSHGARLLVILVAESSIECQQPALEPTLMDAADAKFWYDELSLPLTSRYERLVNHFDCQDEISRQLVLLHVVCQELTTFAQPDGLSQSRWSSYSFDFDQLALAVKIKSRLVEAQVGQDLRYQLAEYLDALIYGPRMEVEVDERRMRKLINKFLGSSNSWSSDLHRTGELFAVPANVDSDVKNQQRILAELIGDS